MRKENITLKKKKLWKLFSAYIRKRDKYVCFTCGKINTGAGMHAGHFIPSSICGVGLRYDESNVHAQCFRCNIHLSGNWVEYRERMIKRYGIDVVHDLERRRHQITKDFDYDGLIEKYLAITKEA